MTRAKIFDALERNARAIDLLIAEGDEALARRAPAVSDWSVAEQVDHLLKVRRSIFELLLSQPPTLQHGMNFFGRVAFSLGWLPRGVGKSPERLRGQPKSAEELRTASLVVAESYGRLRQAEPVLTNPARVLPHPRFGGLTALEALRFADIHDRHHLKLVRDIRR